MRHACAIAPKNSAEWCQCRRVRTCAHDRPDQTPPMTHAGAGATACTKAMTRGCARYRLQILRILANPIASAAVCVTAHNNSERSTVVQWRGLGVHHGVNHRGGRPTLPPGSQPHAAPSARDRGRKWGVSSAKVRAHISRPHDASPQRRQMSRTCARSCIDSCKPRDDALVDDAAPSCARKSKDRPSPPVNAHATPRETRWLPPPPLASLPHDERTSRARPVKVYRLGRPGPLRGAVRGAFSRPETTCTPSPPLKRR